jgi:hypothetical protein
VEGKCATEGGTSETHTCDGADRLIDTGVSYDPLGDTTKLPAADAGEHELMSSYYVDGQVEKQSQNGQTNTYSIDPSGRVRKSVGEGTTNLTTIDHYGGSGEALTWKDDGSGKYTRLIPGIDGSLCATETNGGAPVLQIHDLQGDIVATAALAETETKLLSTYESTEFGVPVNGTPPTKYSWLGAEAVSSELSSGTLVTGTVAYQPQLGRALQTQAVIPPGMAINGAEGTTYISQVSAWSIAGATAEAEVGAHEYAIEQQEAAEREAEEKACPIASMCVEPEEDWIDPEKSILLTTRQAKVAATAMRHGPAILEALAQSGLIKGLTAFFAERLAEVDKEYLQGVAYGLELCYTAINSASKAEARCKLYIDWVVDPIEGKNRIVAWGVETCWGRSYKRRNSVHWTFPYCHTP